MEELLAERGVEVDHVTIFRWVQRFTPELIDAASPCRHDVGDRWFVDETYVKVAGRWRYVYRAVDQYGQVIDVYVSKQRNTAAARKFFTTAISSHGRPREVTTDLVGAGNSVVWSDQGFRGTILSRPIALSTSTSGRQASLSALWEDAHIAWSEAAAEYWAPTRLIWRCRTSTW